MTPNDPLYSQQLHLDLIGDIERIWDEFSGDGVAIGVYDDGFEYTHADLAGNYDASLHFQDDTGTVYDPAPITADDAHGTAVAGIIGAVGNNNEGVVGVAFGASLTGVNALEGPIAANQALFESAMEWAQNFDVMSNSWGRTPVYGSYQNPNNANSSVAGELAGMEVAVQNGRGGLGTFISQAAGNDANDSSLAGSGIFGNANADGLNASRYTATIAATDANGDVADYSNWGSGMLVAAPAVNLTTDLTGADGYRPGDYVQGFNGTSAATPVVSGVVGLMLEANADLGWRDLQNILGISAAQTGSDFGSPAEGFEVSDWFEAAPDENWNGGGMTYSYSYGFGMVDAYAAVRMAEVWSELSGPARTSANEQIVTALPDTDTTASSTAAAVTEQIELLLPDPRNAPLSDDTELPWGDERRPLSESGSDHAPALIDGAVGPHTAPGALAPIADDGITDITFTVAESDNIEIESIAATLDFTHPDTSEVTISLITPDSLELPLFEQEAGYLSPFDAEWTFEVAALLGHGSAGTWTLRITDDTAGNTGSYDGARLEFFGADASNDDVHTITGDYLDIVAEDPARGTLTDSNGGTDWLNLAAIQGNVDLMLQSGQSFSVDGNQWGTIGGAGVDVFENAVTGDGNDTVRGNDGDNRLLGMRGEDTLEGGGGDDTLFGGTGADALSGGAGRDEVNYTTDTAGVAVRLWENSASGGEAAGDVISGFEDVTGGSGNDTINGDGGANALKGGAGNDFLFALGGDDSVLGGQGSDTVYGGGGDDTVEGGAGGDDLRGEGGTDLLSYTTDTAGVAVRLWNNSASGGEAAGDTISGFEDVTGGSGNDTINGDGGANALKGGAGNDFLFALGGDDSVLGGQGSDTVYGGGGDDTVEGGAGGDDLRGEGGTDLLSYTTDTAGVAVRLWNNSASGGEAAGDTISGFEDVTGGSGNDTINGDGGANALKGGGGNDFLFALGGDDTLEGGGGDDTLFGGTGADALSGGAGRDEVNYTTDTAGVAVRLWNNSASGGEAAGDVISGFEDVTGGSGNDTINGDGGANALKGGAGNDFLFALGGDDTLEGGGGDDTLFGGAGADALSGGAGRDEVNYTTDTAGVTVRLWENSASGGEAAGDVISGFEDVTGGSGNDTINGDGGANALKGGGGNDFLFALGGDDSVLGGQGSDTVYGGGGDDTVEGGAGGDDLRGEGGTDLLSYTTDTAGVAVRLWNNSASGGEAAGDTISGFEDVTGGSGNDTINGDGGANALKGGAGNDFLFALGGDDTLEGGGGDDTLFGGTGADALSGGAGRDEVNYTTDTAGVAVRLWNNSASGGEAAGDTISGFEDVTGGSGNDTINGDGGANALKGGAGNDFLFALGGDDTLEGGGGDDTLYGGGADGRQDVFVFAPGHGTDTVKDFADDEDTLEFSGGITSQAQLSLTQQGSDVLIAYGAGDTVLVQDITTAALTDDISFA